MTALRFLRCWLSLVGRWDVDGGSRMGPRRAWFMAKNVMTHEWRKR